MISYINTKTNFKKMKDLGSERNNPLRILEEDTGRWPES